MKTKEKLTAPLMTLNDIDIKKIPCDSPIPEIQIGTILDYSGNYINGFERGASKVALIYCDVINVNGLPSDDQEGAIWAQLENEKCILLGHNSPDGKIPYKDILKLIANSEY